MSFSCLCKNRCFRVLIQSRFGLPFESVALVAETGQEVRLARLVYASEPSTHQLLEAVARVASQAPTGEVDASLVFLWQEAYDELIRAKCNCPWTTGVPTVPGVTLHCCEVFQ